MRQGKGGRNSSKGLNILLGSFIGIFISILFGGILAYLISSEKISDNMIEHGGMIVLILSSYIGSLASGTSGNGRRLQSSILTGVVYYLILLSITALCFKGKYTDVVLGGVCVTAGSLCATVTGCLKITKKSHRGYRPR